jgi:hypothetical protein
LVSLQKMQLSVGLGLKVAKHMMKTTIFERIKQEPYAVKRWCQKFGQGDEWKCWNLSLA